jgi:hypothetical protein
MRENKKADILKKILHLKAQSRLSRMEFRYWNARYTKGHVSPEKYLQYTKALAAKIRGMELDAEKMRACLLWKR